MTDNIVILDVITKLDVPVDRVIDRAVLADLEQVIIIGVCKDGSEYFASSVAGGPECVWALERAKKKLLDIVDD